VSAGGVSAHSLGTGQAGEAAPPSAAPACPDPVCVCACGARFGWLDSPSLGLQDDGDGGLLDLRDCPACGSTRARQVRSTELAPIEEAWESGPHDEDVWTLTDRGRGYADGLARG
jgi:hypothetical protein